MAHDVPLDISEPVADALSRHRPVVALESSYLAEGMPRPYNLEAAVAAQSAVRDHGALAATIGVIGGRIRVGLTDGEIERLGTSDAVTKVGGSDLPFAAISGIDGATTVSGTTAVAAAAGIRVMATGGIGGVHRGVSDTWDISADLHAIARNPVCVVCAGAKAILDLPKTLEVLETLGVPVVGYGVDEFPAFWSRSSGLRVPQRLDTPDQVAKLLLMQSALGRPTGCIVANPVSRENEFPSTELEPIIENALTEAREAGIGGKAVTPFLLGRIGRATGARSTMVNVSLIAGNAALAARIATAYSALRIEAANRPA